MCQAPPARRPKRSLGSGLITVIVDSVLKGNPEVKAYKAFRDVLDKGLRFHVQKVHFRVAQTENIESAAMKRRRIKV